MTRLKQNDIEDIEKSLSIYNGNVKKITGHSLWEVACTAAGVSNIEAMHRMVNLKIHIVPVKSGLGIITGFTETVSGIISYLGFKTTLSKTTDVTGMSEAYEKKADLVFMADDDKFVVFCLKPQQIIDNSIATAKGFIAALDLAQNGLGAKEVLVLGCGPVGIAATAELLRLKAKVSVFDIDDSKSHNLSKTFQNTDKEIIYIETSFEKAMKHHRLIVDATYAADIIGKEYIHHNTLIVAPGMPCGITKEAMVKYPDQILHDPLQIGVATMLAQALKVLTIPKYALKTVYSELPLGL